MSQRIQKHHQEIIVFRRAKHWHYQKMDSPQWYSTPDIRLMIEVAAKSERSHANSTRYEPQHLRTTEESTTIQSLSLRNALHFLLDTIQPNHQMYRLPSMKDSSITTLMLSADQSWRNNRNAFDTTVNVKDLGDPKLGFLLDFHKG